MTSQSEIARELKYGLGLAYILIVCVGSYIGYRTWFGTEDVNYFATRKNLINQVFVKRGWFWFTAVFWASYYGRETKSSFQAAASRYAVATLWWVLFTQWFFGSPIMDKVFMSTGGVCVVESNPSPISTALSGPTVSSIASGAEKLARKALDATEVLPKTSAKCRKLGGSWSGGHDPSGHVFLLVHSSLVLWMEIIPELLVQRRARQKLNWASKVPVGLLTLWAVMLFFTSVYFHSLSEKMSGLFSGLVEPYLIYVYGEAKAWGRVFGLQSMDSTPISAKPIVEPIVEPSGKRKSVEITNTVGKGPSGADPFLGNSVPH